MASSMLSKFSKGIITRIHSISSVHFHQTKALLNVVPLSTFPLQKFCSFSTRCATKQLSSLGSICKTMLPSILLKPSGKFCQPTRTITKYSWDTGEMVTEKEVIKRFFRLNSGYWIRPRAGKAKRMHKKSGKRRYRLRQHVFLNATQCKLLDKMVTKSWKRPKYYIDDPYNPYHERHNLAVPFRKTIKFHGN